MRVIIRTDASIHIGSGHVMRCLTLADVLRVKNIEVSFISRKSPGNLNEIIKNKGYRVHELISGDPAWEMDARQTARELQQYPDIEWLILDHYSLDRRWEQEIRSSVNQLMVIDDLADRQHNCDLLLDQNFYIGMESRYEGLLISACRQLIGPEFALLRPEFAKANQNLRYRDGRVERILIFFGASDRSNETEKALKAIAVLERWEFTVDVVIGINNIHRQAIESLAKNMPKVTCHFNVANMAALMAAADLYVGAAGTTTWERCCLGLPSLVITVAANQVQATKDLDRIGVLTHVGESALITVEQIAAAVENCMQSPSKMKRMADKGLQLVDGLGASRCADAILLCAKGEADGE